ncbi:sterile alpha motif-like domain-containing protein [Facklamia sp. 7083-14-GEN3]|uniref:sterile alpha motif-like domain-containing protein n=1 Tax=Facklamia sp. 7083-14-GEN3 TaxID=2973478 RepID=UPI00215D1E93|nr:sterile alpha motif-like domain-containing protein [Facklamia sp. 7083-14-GEN3]MCR8968829.1 sterile alpha motif-like domain-containing protein [Facklamia sp. 7083-14-GEN3]
MGPSFYEFIMRYVDESANDPMSRLANAVSNDIAFPKHSHDFQKISDYLEKNSQYSRLLTVFDDAWHQYQYAI